MMEWPTGSRPETHLVPNRVGTLGLAAYGSFGMMIHMAT